MTKFIRTTAIRMTTGMVHGFAQMGSFGQTRRRSMKSKTVSEALRGDWLRLGGDMRRAIDKHEPKARA